MKARILTFIFFGIAISELLGEAWGNASVVYVFKPLLMVSLGLVFIFSTGIWSHRFHTLILLALIFSFGGDVALMFTHLSEAAFLVGLGSFLIAHLCYIAAFVNSAQSAQRRSILIEKPILLVLLVAYAGGLVFFLYPNLGSMAVPVIGYAAAILGMMLAALNRYGKVSNESFWMVLLGALLFMFSDSLIAINKFQQPFDMARLFIMTTYISGQYYIVLGCIQQNAVAIGKATTG